MAARLYDNGGRIQKEARTQIPKKQKKNGKNVFFKKLIDGKVWVSFFFKKFSGWWAYVFIIQLETYFWLTGFFFWNRLLFLASSVKWIFKPVFRRDFVERRSVRESLEAERIPRRRHRLYHFRPFDLPISCFCLECYWSWLFCFYD